MRNKTAARPQTTTESQKIAKLLDQYGCGAVRFSGTSDALFERHLLFDRAVDVATATPRDRFEAVARSVRDVLSQRWLLTEKTYERQNPKRLYYLSMEFLIGRSLANNVTNLLLDPLRKQGMLERTSTGSEILEQEPDAGLGNGGLGRLAACFIESAATMQLPAMGYGLRYEYGIFNQSIRDGWQQEKPDHWLRAPDPWEVARPNEKVEIGLACSFELSGGGFRAVPGRPSTLIGIPYDRPVVGYGGSTINTLRLWEADAPDYFDFAEFSSGDFVEALANTLSADTLTRVLYPDDSTSAGQGLRLRAGVFPGCLLAGRCGAPLPPQQLRLESVSRKSRHPAERYPPGDGGPRTHADSAGRGASRMGRGLGHHEEHAGVYESHAAARSAREMAASLV